MSNLQVPDPGLLCKLESFVMDSAGSSEHCLDVRIVCADGEFFWSSILLSAISPVIKSLLLPQTRTEAEQVLIFPDVNKEDLQFLLQSVISADFSSVEGNQPRKYIKLLLLLGIEKKYLKVKESSNVKIIASASPKLERMALYDEVDAVDGTDGGAGGGIDILYQNDADISMLSSVSRAKSSRKMFCKLCSLSFETKSYSDYQDHINSHKNSSGLFVCNRAGCSKTFKAWCHLSDHCYSHGNSPKPHLCSYCSYTSITRANVRKHEIAVHEDPDRRDFVCATCDKKFKTSSNLMEHAKIHLDSKKKCEHCRKEFKSQVGYNQHLRIHSGSLFACEVCGEKLQSKHSVTRHQRDIHGIFSGGDGKRIFRCQKKQCSAEFYQEEEFRLHVRTAHQDKASVFICHLCRKFCSSKVTLKQHFKKMHSSSPSSPIATTTITENKTVVKAGKNRKKSLLKLPKHDNSAVSRLPGVEGDKKKFRLDRNRHLATHEEGEFSCPHCHLRQPSRLVLNMHQRYCTSRGEGGEDIVVFVEDQSGLPSDQAETVIMM